MLNCNKIMEQLMRKHWSDSKYELIFLQLVRVLGNLLETLFGGEVKDTFVYPDKLKTDSNNTYILSDCCWKKLKGCNASITAL